MFCDSAGLQEYRTWCCSESWIVGSSEYWIWLINSYNFEFWNMVVFLVAIVPFVLFYCIVLNVEFLKSVLFLFCVFWRNWFFKQFTNSNWKLLFFCPCKLSPIYILSNSIIIEGLFTQDHLSSDSVYYHQLSFFDSNNRQWFYIPLFPWEFLPFWT